MPLLPSDVLFYVFPYPVFYYFIWIYFEGCPWTVYTQENTSHLDPNKNMIQTTMSRCGIKWTNEQMDDFVNLVMMLSVILSAYKVIFHFKNK